MHLGQFIDGKITNYQNWSKKSHLNSNFLAVEVLVGPRLSMIPPLELGEGASGSNGDVIRVE